MKLITEHLESDLDFLIEKDENGNKQKYYRKYAAKNLTMEEKYELAIDDLKEIKQKHEVNI